METRANHVWVGGVTLTLMAVLAAFIIWIARLGEGNKHEFDIFFKQSVDGLSKGSSVSFSGVPVGQVVLIELWRKDPGFVRVRIAVNKDVPILVGTTATIQGSFTGVSNIQLDGATKGAPLLSCSGDDRLAACPEGVPVIPTKRGGFGELLNNAPLLLERLATLTERMTQVFSDKNQAAIEGILANTEKVTGDLAKASPEAQRTMIELRETLVEAHAALASFQHAAASTDAMVNSEIRPMLSQFNKSLKSIERSSDQLEGFLADARPGAKRLSETTLPEAEASIRDLRAATKALKVMTEKLNDQGAKGILGGDQLPNYKP